MRLVISDAHEGLKAAIRKHFAGASWQRCRCTSPATSSSGSPKATKTWSPQRSTWSSCTPDQAGVTTASDDTQRLLAKQFLRVAELMATAKTDVLAFSAFPPEHWKKIWSNNPLERLN